MFVSNKMIRVPCIYHILSLLCYLLLYSCSAARASFLLHIQFNRCRVLLCFLSLCHLCSRGRPHCHIQQTMLTGRLVLEFSVSIIESPFLVCTSQFLQIHCIGGLIRAPGAPPWLCVRKPKRCLDARPTYASPALDIHRTGRLLRAL